MAQRTMCAASIAAAVMILGILGILGVRASAQQDADQPAGAAGQTATARQQTQPTRTIDPDRLFVKHVALGGRYEQQLARLAQQKSSSPEVRQIAERVLRDHGQARQPTELLAQQLDVEIPQQLPPEKQEKLEVFQSLSEPDFDQHFLSDLKAGYAHDVMLYRDAAKMARSEQVRTYAQQQYPALQQRFLRVMAAAGETVPPSMSDRVHPDVGREGDDESDTGDADGDRDAER